MNWRDNVRRVEPYVPGEQPNKPNMVKLNTNECPYPPAPGVERIAREMDCNQMRLYPDPECNVLVEALADFYKLSPEQIFVGVGSDDVLSMCFLTFFNNDKPILFPDVTYAFYDVWANLYRIPFEVCPLDENFHINPEDYKKPNGGIIFPNPNAPTGLLEPLHVVEDIVKSNPDSVVIVDEAYIDFGGKSCLELIDKYDNLLIVQTFSKSRSMAGCRIGFAMGNRELIKYLEDAKFSFNSYTMNQPSLLMGAESVKDRPYFEKTVAKVVNTRERVKKQLTELGFTFPEAMGNFIFASHKSVPAKEIFLALKEQDIYVRFWDKPRISNHLRISIGTDEEMDRLIEALTKIVER
ncbi:MAG: histidinol-phosphate transaminase [Lachnospiraceae bacterium]|nr:histidinol-phosphate transaminase [Lachnospiraceae bacterium]